MIRRFTSPDRLKSSSKEERSFCFVGFATECTSKPTSMKTFVTSFVDSLAGYALTF